MSSDLYRKNAAVVVFRRDKKVLVLERADGLGWQFPQGGVDEGEQVCDAAVRELFEETGIKSAKLVACLDESIRYDFPEFTLEQHKKKGYAHIGQDQFWSLLFFDGDDSEIRFDAHPEGIEFKQFKWVDFEFAVENVWEAKRKSYQFAYDNFKALIDNFE